MNTEELIKAVETVELVTVKYVENDVTCTVTQQYKPYFDSGHYCYAITNSTGDILATGASAYGAPKGKVEESHAKEYLKGYLRYNK